MDKFFATDKKFKIKPKRDWPNSGKGFYDRGEWINRGFVVTRGGCNIMPGATWFRTIPEAMRAIRIFSIAETSDQFWDMIRDKSDMDAALAA